MEEVHAATQQEIFSYRREIRKLSVEELNNIIDACTKQKERIQQAELSRVQEKIRSAINEALALDLKVTFREPGSDPWVFSESSYISVTRD